MTLDEAIQWKKVDDFPSYSISNTGLVRNDITNKIKTLQHDKYGYAVCSLYDHQKRKQKKIHRLIAEALYSDIIHRFDYCDDFLEMLEEAPTIFEEGKK